MRPSIHLAFRIPRHVIRPAQCASPTSNWATLLHLGPHLLSSAMPGPSNPSHQTRLTSSKAKKPPPVARPSSSVLLISPQNEILLLHRVQSSSSFPAAHVFPGGNLDAFHDGAIPGPDDPGRHTDGAAYRLGAVRECFEETGILLAKRRGGGVVEVERGEREEGRRRVHGNEVRFGEWLASIDAEADLDGLIPFTRWITPSSVQPKRFTTQMYLYMLPLSSPPHASQTLIAREALLDVTPTPDGGLEHTAADFLPPSHALALAAMDKIALWPPQFYLVHLLSQFLKHPDPYHGSVSLSVEELAAQRSKLLSFVNRVPTGDTYTPHETGRIGWGEKVMSPKQLGARVRGKIVLGLDGPGPELAGTGRGGDWERVVLVRMDGGRPFDMEVGMREAVLKESAEASGKL